jgi:hypothetical protein
MERFLYSFLMGCLFGAILFIGINFIIFLAKITLEVR